MISAGRSRSRWLVWWALARHAAERLTMPKTDVPLSDAEAWRIVAGSAAGRRMSSLIDLFGRAWADSLAGRAVMSLGRDCASLDRAAAIRVVGAAGAAAAVVALALQLAEPTAVGPFSWLLPAICAAIGVLAMMRAPSIARAIESRRP
jgi:hypothetical protein